MDYKEGNGYFRLFANLYIKDAKSKDGYVLAGATKGQDLFVKVAGVFVPLTKVAYEIKVDTFNKIERAGDVRVAILYASSASKFDIVQQAQALPATTYFNLDGNYIDASLVETTKPNRIPILYQFVNTSQTFVIAAADTVAELFLNVQTIFVPLSRFQHFVNAVQMNMIK